MGDYISRKEICSELGIDEPTLIHYEDFLGLQIPVDGSYHKSIVRLVVKVNELVSSGLSFDDIHHISSFAEQFAEHIPSLAPFKELSPREQLRSITKDYFQLLSEFSEKDKLAKEKISRLEHDLREQKSESSSISILHERIKTLEKQSEKLETQLQEKNTVIDQAYVEFEALQRTIEELEYKNAEQENYASELKLQLENTSSDTIAKAPVDIDFLLKKQERDITMRYQKQIYDLKKQVEQLVEDKEKIWRQGTN
jgi:DNA repair exonuclease SbcCD ATPase subunit